MQNLQFKYCLPVPLFTVHCYTVEYRTDNQDRLGYTLIELLKPNLKKIEATGYWHVDMKVP